MDSAGSITQRLLDFQGGDEEAANLLWDRYFRQLAAAVRAQMPSIQQTTNDESDVALSAFHSFFRGIQAGKFNHLHGRDQMWRLLVVIAKRKAIDHLRHELAMRRGGGKITGGLILEQFAGSDPTPETVVSLIDELRGLLGLLRDEDPVLTLIATRKCEGSSNQEIADNLSLSIRTIQRKLNRIEIIWDEAVQHREKGA